MNRAEQKLHISVAKYLDAVLPKDAWWTTIPLGGGGKLRGAFLKAMGTKKGTPDILIVHGSIASFIELKSEDGQPSPAQMDTSRDICRAGGDVAICRSIDDVESALNMWRIPLRGSIAA